MFSGLDQLEMLRVRKHFQLHRATHCERVLVTRMCMLYSAAWPQSLDGLELFIITYNYSPFMLTIFGEN